MQIKLTPTKRWNDNFLIVDIGAENVTFEINEYTARVPVTEAQKLATVLLELIGDDHKFVEVPKDD